MNGFYLFDLFSSGKISTPLPPQEFEKISLKRIFALILKRCKTLFYRIFTEEQALGFQGRSKITWNNVMDLTCNRRLSDRIFRVMANWPYLLTGYSVRGREWAHEQGPFPWALPEEALNVSPQLKMLQKICIGIFFEGSLLVKIIGCWLLTPSPHSSKRSEGR